MKRSFHAFLCLIVVLWAMVGGSGAQAADGSTVVYRTKTGECYHLATCRTLRKTKLACTLEEAVNTWHLRACSICCPPGLGTEKGNQQAGTQTSQTTGNYILNTSSKVFHLTGCSSAAKIGTKNRQNSTAAREELLREGYKPCGRCQP